MVVAEKVQAVLDALQVGWTARGYRDLDRFMDNWCGAFHGPKGNGGLGDPNPWNVTVGASSARFRMEISTIHLRRMGFVHVLVLGGDGAEVREALLRFRSEVWSGRQLPIVLCATDSTFTVASRSLPHGPGLILSRSDIEDILSSSSPGHALRLQMLRQIPFKRLIPFTITHPAVGVTFFGRKEEIETLLLEDHVDYAIFGPGFVGKTSVLRQLRWLLRRRFDPRNTRTVEVDLYSCSANTDEAARKIAQRISHTSFSHGLTVEGMVAFLRRVRFGDPRFHEGPIELVIDEVDEVLAHDKRMGYPLLRAFRLAKHLDLIRLTISGRKVPKEVVKDPESPFHGRMHLMELGPLNWQHARELLRLPLEHLNVQCDDVDGLLKRVVAMCGREPMKIQKWGLEIANRAAENAGRRFTEADLRSLERDMAKRD